MAQTEKVILEVYAAATYSLSTPIHIKAGVVGDDITFVVTATAVGSWTDDVTVALTGAPTGAVVTYVPDPPAIGDGESVTITIDTDACSAGTSTMTIAAAA